MDDFKRLRYDRFFASITKRYLTSELRVIIGEIPDEVIISQFPDLKWITPSDLKNYGPESISWAFVWVESIDHIEREFFEQLNNFVRPGGIMCGNGLLSNRSLIGSVMQNFDFVDCDFDRWIYRKPIDDFRLRNIFTLNSALAAFIGMDQTVRFLPNPGNAGDALIARGTYESLDMMNINVCNESDVVLIGGGGNLIPLYNSMRNQLEKLPRTGLKVVILPSTVVGCFDLLREFDDLLLLARDPVTWERAMREGINCQLCHDAAFEVDLQSIGELGVSESILYNFRMDRESARTIDRHRGGNYDLSEECGTGHWSRSRSIEVSDCFVRAISRFEEIQTDRLHVAIVAARLGRRVKLFANSYHKNKGVFKLSMEGHYNVEFVD